MKVQNRMKNSKRKAFTLVELLVVIAIIGILFVVLISKVDFATDKAKATGVQTDFRSYQLAIEAVARENAGLSILVDNDAEGDLKYAALEAALNKNLDPRLHVEIDADGKISTKAKDPWKEKYLGAYLAPDEDGTVKDRGAIIMYSKGSNLKLGTDAAITNGVVSTTMSDETAGKDDFKIAVIYTYLNGYGKIQTTTDGFSNDIEGDETDVDNNAPENPVEPDVPNTPDNPEQGGVQDPVEMNGGLYDANDNLLADWSTLTKQVEDGGYGMDIEKDYDYVTYKTDTSSPYYVLKNNSSLATGVQVKISDTVTKIGSYAFSDCQQLTALEIGNGVTSIGECAFNECSGLTGVLVIPSSVTSIGEFAFRYCNGFTGILVDDENAVYHDDGNCLIETTSKTLILGCNNSVIPNNNSVTIIGDWAFYKCSGLTGDLVIPDGVTIIGDMAFCQCSGFTGALVIPNGVTSIGDYAFWYCSGLTGTLVIPDGVKSIGIYAFSDCSGLTGKLVIPDSVTSIGNSAFWYCEGLTGLDLGSGVTSIGESAFRYCKGLTGTLVIPEGVTKIRDDTFNDCSGLTSITIPDSVTSIGEAAFWRCSKLTSITIPDGVTSIGDYAFKNCSSMTSIVFEGTMEQWNAMSFGVEWNTGLSATEVICSNGTVTIE